MDPRAQLVKLKQVSRLERESGIPEFCEALVRHMFTVPATAAQARNVLEYTLGAIMTRMPEIEEEAAAENMEEWGAPNSPGAAAPYSPGAAAPYSPAAAAPYSPGAGSPSFSSRLEPPPVIKHNNRRRLNLGNENEEGEEGEGGEEGDEINSKHLASVAWQLASEQPLHALKEELDAARSSGTLLQLCLKKLFSIKLLCKWLNNIHRFMIYQNLINKC